QFPQLLHALGRASQQLEVAQQRGFELGEILRARLFCFHARVHPSTFVASMFITSRIITSFCAGSDSATSSVSAARPMSLMTGWPRSSSRRPLRLRKSTNRNAAL